MTELVTTLTAGALVRRAIRAHLDVIGVRWTEHRGLIDSTFVVRGDEGQMAQVQALVARANEGATT